MLPLITHASPRPLPRPARPLTARPLTAALLAATLLAATLLAAGCLGSANTRYFLLSPTTWPTATAPAAGLVVIRSCQLPDYLNRTEMIMRKGQNEVVIRDFDSWAQAPEKMIRLILRENLARILGAENIAEDKSPQSRSGNLLIDYEFRQLDPTTDGLLAVNVDCRLHALATKTDAIHNLAFTIPLAGKDGADIATAVNQALARIAEETAMMLK